MSEEWYRAYDFERDHEYIERLQAASVQVSGFALNSDHGLVGTSTWWAAIEAGTIPITRVQGTIVDIRVNTANWPEFEIEDAGIMSTWALEGDIKTYRVGGGARIDYVTLRYANPPEVGDDSAKVVLGIWVEI